MECSGALLTTQFAYRICPGTCDARLCVPCTLQSALESGQQARILQIDFSALLIQSTIREFFISPVLWVLEVLCCLYPHTVPSNRPQHVMVDSCRVNWLAVCQECHRAVFLGRYCSFCTARSDHYTLQKKLICFAANIAARSIFVTFGKLLFSLALLSFYGLVLWGWGLRTFRVLNRSLPALDCLPFFR